MKDSLIIGLSILFAIMILLAWWECGRCERIIKRYEKEQERKELERRKPHEKA